MTFTVEILNEHALNLLRELEEMRIIRMYKAQGDKNQVSSNLEVTVSSFEHPFMSAEEIRQHYPNEWVLIADPLIEGVEVRGGRVLAHDSDKRSLALQGRTLIRQYARVTHFYTGEIPGTAKIGLIRRINQP